LALKRDIKEGRGTTETQTSLYNMRRHFRIDFPRAVD